MLCSTTAASAAATITPESMVWSRLPISSSSVKVTAAMGALKAAAMPAAMPTEVMRFWFFGLSRAMRARKLLTPAQICTVGPFHAQRSSAAELDRAQHELANRLLDGDDAGAEGVGDFHLGNAAARRRRNPVGEPQAGHEAADRRRQNRPPDPAWPGAAEARSISSAYSRATLM